MALKIRDYKISSNRTHHTARLAPGKQHAWEVSWLPGRHLNRNQAITAMVIADTTADGDVRPGHRAWPHVQGRAAKLGMTAHQALDRVSGPPQWARHQEKTADPPGTDWPDRPDPIDLGWTDEYDGPAPEYPDPSWPGSGPSRHPTYMFNLAVSPWYKERYPDKSANLWDTLRAGRDHHPAPEPDNPPDWEAGQ